MQLKNKDLSLMGNDKNSKLVGIFLLFALLLNFPIIGIFSKEGRLFNIPSLYLYLFAAWALMIVLLYILSKNKKK